MKSTLGILVVLALAGTAFGVPTYVPQTLDYPCIDLAPVVDPQPQAGDVLPGQQCGIPLATYNALPPQVVHFNVLPQGPNNPGPIDTIVAHYDCTNPNKTVTIDKFVNLTLNFGGNGNFGLVPTSWDPSNDSVAGLHDDVFNNPGGAGGRPWPTPEQQAFNEGLRWFGCDITCSEEMDEYVDSFAFTACGQPAGNFSCAPGNAYFLLSDGSYGIVPYVIFGGNSPQHVSIAYQAPEGLAIKGVDCIALAQNHCNYLDLDDFGFTVVPEPATMLLLATGGIGLVLRRKR